VGSWEEGSFVVENFLTRLKTELSPPVLQLLESFEDYRPRQEVQRLLANVPGVDRLVGRLLARDILVQQGSALDAREHQLDEAWKWRLPARYYYFSTRDVPFEPDLRAEHDGLAELARHTPPPPPFKQAPSPVQPLPKREMAEAGSFFETLARRRTRRNFRRAPIPQEDFAALLGWTWGYSRLMTDPGVGQYLLKTSPSGGARHPIEVYPIVLRVKGLQPGVYHYSVKDHGLSLIRKGRFDERVVRLCADQPWVRDAAAVFIMTAVLGRSMWKYVHEHALRVVLLDAGHLGQTFHLVATELGLAPFTTAAIRDSEVERLLDIDGVKEIPLYIASVGHPRDSSR
jgi:SagB-type dehydrogenase family enzyme